MTVHLPSPVFAPRKAATLVRKQLRVLLVSMPWAPLEISSLALSVLGPVAGASPGVSQVDTLYANIRWADHILKESHGQLGPEDYEAIVLGYFVGTGEWIFSSCLHGEMEPEQTLFHRVSSKRGANLARAVEMYRIAAAWIEELVGEVVAGGYDVVGLTSTFDQNMASLALAGAIKRLAPEIVTVMGGANCDGPSGAALHRNYESVDYVIRGEAESSFPDLLGVLAGSAEEGEDRDLELAQVSSLCWRDYVGVQRVNDAKTGLTPAALMPRPRQQSYFEQFRASSVGQRIRPRVQLEASRGCWWGPSITAPSVASMGPLWSSGRSQLRP